MTKDDDKLLLKAGTLDRLIREKMRHAVRCGAIQSIATKCESVEQDGIVFLVRVLTGLLRKEQAKIREAALTGVDPFLPYDEDLFVADISPTHVCLFNKFNVVDSHLLLVTRHFEDQENLLTLSDFEAMWACLAELDGLGFYNAGSVAGASQPHKHLQLVPLPLSAGVRLPLDPIIRSAVPELPFGHAVAHFAPDMAGSPVQAARVTFDHYRAMAARTGIESGAGPKVPYNLLLTREWMLLVPRSRECFDSISMNSLAFAGAFFVKDERQFEFLQSRSLMGALAAVATA